VQFGASIRHEERNANEGWGLRETRDKNKAEAQKPKSNAGKNHKIEPDFYPD
jgi:hypothetical protein